MFKYLLSLFTKKEELFGSRSYEWSKIRNEFLKENPTCAACGRNKKLEIHHIKPFHLNPELELDPSIRTSTWKFTSLPTAPDRLDFTFAIEYP